MKVLFAKKMQANTMSENEYFELKTDIIQEISLQSDNKTLLEEIKDMFRPVINSNRRHEVTNDIATLLKLLEKRDCLSGQNIKYLNVIVNKISKERQLHNRELLIDISIYEDKLQRHGYGGCHSYLDKHQKPAEGMSSSASGNVYYSMQGEHSRVSVVKKNLVYDCIASEIGRNWRELARNLEVKEGEIDELEEKYPRDLKSKVFQVFVIFEHRSDPNYWQYNLGKALDSARRKDIRNRVELIMAMNK